MSGPGMTGIGEETEVGALEEAGWVARVRGMLSEKMSYALGDQVVFSFGNMIVAALISRHCTSWEFGIYILTQRAVDVALQLCNVFFWAPFVFNLPGTPEERRPRYLGSVTLHQTIACVLTVGVMWLMTKWAHTPERGIYYGVFAPLMLTTAGLMFRGVHTADVLFADAVS